MAQKVNLKVKGVIENMSWFVGDDGKRYELFGAGGGDALSEVLDAPLLGQVPLLSELREGGDSGRPIMLTDPDGDAAVAFARIAERIEVELAPTRRIHPELKLL
jgi:ATP-binding protein involved in chromosome partitioning